MIITALQLAAILDISERDAHKKIAVCKYRADGNNQVAISEAVLKYTPKFIEVTEISEYLKLDIAGLLKLIQKDYLTSTGTKRYILIDYPSKVFKKIVCNGEKHVLKIPKKLASVLSDKQIGLVHAYWSKYYSKEADIE